MSSGSTPFPSDDSEYWQTRESLMRELESSRYSKEAANKILDRHFRVMFQLARQVRIPIDALDETVNQAAENLLKALPKFRYNRRKGRFRDYVKRVIVNTFLHSVRERERKPLHGLDHELLAQLARDPLGENRMESNLRMEEISAAFDRTLADVNPKHQAAVRLRLLEGEPSAVVAKRLGLSVANVDQIIARFRRKLKEILRKQDQDSDEFWGGPKD